MILKKIIKLSVLCNVITGLAGDHEIAIVRKTRAGQQLRKKDLQRASRFGDDIVFNGVELKCLNCLKETFFRCLDCHKAPYCSAACEYFDFEKHESECKKDA